jgi:hypothetical protein
VPAFFLDAATVRGSNTLTAGQALTAHHSFLWYVAAVSVNGKVFAWSSGGTFTVQ